MHLFHRHTHRCDGSRGRRFARDGGPDQESGRGTRDGFGRRGFGRGGGRVFDHGALRLVVLALVAEKPRHGYEIIKAIEERLADTYSPSPGVIYPTLTLLEELGHATVTEAGGKKQYAITQEGMAYLDAHRPALDAALARMDGVRAAHGDGPSPAVLRATESLKLALRLRFARGPLTPEQAQAVAAALDAAVQAIERS